MRFTRQSNIGDMYMHSAESKKATQDEALESTKATTFYPQANRQQQETKNTTRNESRQPPSASDLENKIHEESGNSTKKKHRIQRAKQEASNNTNSQKRSEIFRSRVKLLQRSNRRWTH